MIFQAIAPEELGLLIPDDIRLREGKIFIAGSRKANERELALEAHQAFELMDYIQETQKMLLTIRGYINSSLFISMGTGEHFHKIMRKIIDQLRKQDRRIISLQQLRASVISSWLKTHHICKAQYMAGHRFISSTERYQANNMDSLKDYISRYHPDI